MLVISVASLFPIAFGEGSRSRGAIGTYVAEALVSAFGAGGALAVAISTALMGTLLATEFLLLQILLRAGNIVHSAVRFLAE